MNNHSIEIINYQSRFSGMVTSRYTIDPKTGLRDGPYTVHHGDELIASGTYKDGKAVLPEPKPCVQATERLEVRGTLRQLTEDTSALTMA